MTEPAGSTAQGKQPEKATPAPRGSPQHQKDRPAPASAPAPATGSETTKSNKKRRKVNHACIYCRRSHMTCDLERPCTRCIKRGIGHLCHDEPRDSVKRSKTEPEGGVGENATTEQDGISQDAAKNAIDRRTSAPDAGLNLAPPPLPPNRGASTAAIAQPTPVSAPQMPSLTSINASLLNFNDWTSASRHHFHDIHQLHPPQAFVTSEVSDEYSLLNSFITGSLMDDSVLYAGMDLQQQYLSDPSLNTMPNIADTLFNQGPSNNAQFLPPPAQLAAGNSIQRPASGIPIDKAARERYYKAAADPAGTDSPEERINALLKEKMTCGLLHPFNYVKGYARMNHYIEQNLQQMSRVRILRQLDRFRPKFRERMQSLTDVELLRVEMWFELTLMEYDRVFASMAMPACCWRRTGEIYRGNKEMSELIHVPMSRLRDGNIALHEIIAENSLVSYWEKFGQIAFDPSQKAILTTCSLKNPDPNSGDPEIKCCFSFTIKRDMYNIPAMIVGNFLPIEPASTRRQPPIATNNMP